MNTGVVNRCSLWWHDEALLSRVSHQAIVKRSLDISLQEGWGGGGYVGEGQSSQPPGIHRPAGLPTPPLRLPICSQFTRVPSPPSWEELGNVGSFGIELLRIRKIQTKNAKPKAPEEESHHH